MSLPGNDRPIERREREPIGNPVPIDRATVARLRREIAAGRYALDAECLADALIADIDRRAPRAE